MAKRHWLDPLARRLLNAADRIATPIPTDPSGRAPRARRSAETQGWQLDVNRANAAEWQQLPGCTATQADLLLRLQLGGVQLSGVEDLQRLLNLDALTLEQWRPLLVFRWYDAPAAIQNPVLVPLNQAGGQVLQGQLGLSPDRSRRLLRERGRGPFLDLADLQLRLQFPPQVIEAMIGKVEFTPAEPGPRLPDPKRLGGERQSEGRQEGRRGPKLPLTKG